MTEAVSPLILLACVPPDLAPPLRATLEKAGFRLLEADSAPAIGQNLAEHPDIQAVLLDLADAGEARLRPARELHQRADLGLVLLAAEFGPAAGERLASLPHCHCYRHGSGDFLLLSAIRAATAGRVQPSRIRESHPYHNLVSEMAQGVAVHEAIQDASGKLVDYRFIDVNPSFEHLTGLRRQDILGRTVRQVLPTIEPRWLEHYEEVVNSGTIRHFEDFSAELGKHYEVTAYRPQPGQFAVVINDVTERKANEARLERQHLLFERLVETSSAGIMMVDRSGQIIFSNPQANSILGILPGVAPQRSYNAPEWRISGLGGNPMPDDALPFNQVRTSLAPHNNIQFAVHRPDGRRILVSVNAAPLFDSAGEFDGMVSTVSDITERTHTENVLRTSEDRFRNLADNGMALIWSAGAERTCNFFNKPWLEFTGRSMAEQLGTGWMEGVHPDDRPHCLDIYRQAWAERVRFSMDYRLKRHDGVYRWIQDDGTPCHDSNGGFTGYIGHCLDITDHKLAISRINILLSEKDLLLKEVHHRIKNNMSSIMGLLTLQAQKLQNPVVTKALDSAISRIRSMALLYDKLYRTPEFRQISLREYLPSLVGEIAHTFPRTPKVDFDLKVDNVIVRVNTVVPVGIIINELITNSMKYAFAGRASGRICLQALKQDDSLVLRLGDDGPGLPAGFDPVKASGFGLQLCTQLSKELGGTMETLPPPGTTFVITLPL